MMNFIFSKAIESTEEKTKEEEKSKPEDGSGESKEKNIREELAKEMGKSVKVNFERELKRKINILNLAKYTTKKTSDMEKVSEIKGKNLKYLDY